MERLVERFSFETPLVAPAREARRMAGVRPSAIRDLLRLGADPTVTSFGGGYPDASLFPVEQLRAAFQSVLTGDPGRALQYTTTDGLPELRELVAGRLRADGIDAASDGVLITHGGQQGMDLIGRMFLDPGDVVVTENPTFLGALISFAPNEPRYAPVRTDELGMDTDDLERVLATTERVKFIYTVPDFHNPTGVTLSLERRQHLLELARRHDLLVIEDTPYRALRFEGAAVPSLASLDTDGRVIHLGSFSKILAPGLRLGWLAATPALRDRLSLLKLAADTQSGTLAMAATVAVLTGFDVDAHVRSTLPVYAHKRDLMLAAFAAHLPDSIGWSRPEGGLFTWLTFPEGFDATAFMRDVALPEANVAYVPGASFYPTVPEPHHARLSYSGQPDEAITDGIARLGALLHGRV